MLLVSVAMWMKPFCSFALLQMYVATHQLEKYSKIASKIFLPLKVNNPTSVETLISTAPWNFTSSLISTLPVLECPKIMHSKVG